MPLCYSYVLLIGKRTKIYVQYKLFLYGWVSCQTIPIEWSQGLTTSTSAYGYNTPSIERYHFRYRYR